MTPEEWAILDQENQEAMNMANHRTAPASNCTGYHIAASREDAEAFRVVQGQAGPLSPGAIHREFTINENGEVEAKIPEDYREPRTVIVAKAVLIAALTAHVAAWLAEAIMQGSSNPFAYAAVAGTVAFLGYFAKRR